MKKEKKTNIEKIDRNKKKITHHEVQSNILFSMNIPIYHLIIYWLQWRKPISFVLNFRFVTHKFLLWSRIIYFFLGKWIGFYFECVKKRKFLFVWQILAAQLVLEWYQSERKIQKQTKCRNIFKCIIPFEYQTQVKGYIQ